MLALVLGLVLFLGAHSVRIVADGWRTRLIAQRGPGVWKLAYTVLSLVGLVLIVWGYGQARQTPVVLWPAAVWTRHLAALLTVPAMVLLVAAHVPGNGLKARLGHPMVLGTKVWALAHLLANNTLADVLLFGGFALWAVLDFRSARRRDAAAGVVPAAVRAGATATTVAAGVGLWAVIAFWAHGVLFGVRPFG